MTSLITLAIGNRASLTAAKYYTMIDRDSHATVDHDRPAESYTCFDYGAGMNDVPIANCVIVADGHTQANCRELLDRVSMNCIVQGEPAADMKVLCEGVMEGVRYQVERSDQLSGFNIFHDLTSDLGGLLTSLVLEKLKDEYPMALSQCMTLSSSEHSELNSISTMKSAICIESIQKHATLSMCFDSYSLIKYCQKQRSIEKPTLDDIISAWAQYSVNWLSPCRLLGEQRSSFRKILTSLLPFQNLKWVIPSQLAYGMEKEEFVSKNPYPLLMKTLEMDCYLNSCGTFEGDVVNRQRFFGLGSFFNIMALTCVIRGNQNNFCPEKLLLKLKTPNRRIPRMDYLDNRVTFAYVAKDFQGLCAPSMFTATNNGAVIPLLRRISEHLKLLDFKDKKSPFSHSLEDLGFDSISNMREQQENINEIIEAYTERINDVDGNGEEEDEYLED